MERLCLPRINERMSVKVDDSEASGALSDNMAAGEPVLPRHRATFRIRTWVTLLDRRRSGSSTVMDSPSRDSYDLEEGGASALEKCSMSLRFAGGTPFPRAGMRLFLSVACAPSAGIFVRLFSFSLSLRNSRVYLGSSLNMS